MFENLTPKLPVLMNICGSTRQCSVQRLGYCVHYDQYHHPDVPGNYILAAVGTNIIPYEVSPLDDPYDVFVD